MPSADIIHKDGRSREELIRAVRLSEGQFSLVFAHCNYISTRARIVERIRTEPSIGVTEIHLRSSALTLYTIIQDEIGGAPPNVLMVYGLERVRDPDNLMTASNQARDEFLKNFPFPLILRVRIGDEISSPSGILTNLYTRAASASNGWSCPSRYHLGSRCRTGNRSEIRLDPSICLI